MKSSLTYSRLLTYVRPYRSMFIAGIVAMVFLAASETAVAAVLQPLIDGSFVEKDPQMVALMPFIVIGVFAIRGASTFASTMCFSWIGNKVVLDIRHDMFRQLLVLPASFYDRHATGNIISKISYDVTQVTEAATNALTVIVKDTFTVIGLTIWMLFLNWKLSLTTIVVLPLIMIVLKLTSKRMRYLNRDLQQTMGDMTHVLEESVKGYKVVKIFGGQDYESGRFHQVANWVRRLQMKIKTAAAVNVLFVEGFSALCFAIIIYVGTSQAAAGHLTVGGFVSFFTAMGLLFSPLKRLTKVNEVIQKGIAASESVFALNDELPEQDDGRRTIQQAKGQIRFEDVSMRFEGTELAALDKVDISIQPGETVALVGPSGSGKTTLVSLLTRFYQPSNGRIYFDDIDINELTLNGLRQNIAYVGQDVVLFNDTIAANIAYGMNSTPDSEAIQQAADQAFVSEFTDQLPNGLNTQIGENGVRLSGGQRQRIAIARAFLKNAPLLILDEATSALDTTSERHVQLAIEALESRCSTIVIAHRLSTVEQADCIYVMNKGRVVESGQHQPLLDQCGLYHKLYTTQFE